MQPVAAAIDTESASKRSRRRPIDRRTRAGRRATELAAAFEAELGGELSPSQRLAVRHAALMTAIAEGLQQRQLAGEAIDLDQMIRASNAARRAVGDLSIGASTNKPAHVPLRERLVAERAR